MPYQPYLKHEADYTYGRAEVRLNEALDQAMAGAVPEPHPQELFPPRIGYDRTQATVEDIFMTDRTPVSDNRFDYSGMRGSYGATPRPGIAS